MFKQYCVCGLFLLAGNVYANNAQWEGGFGSADQACKTKVDDGESAYQYSHAEVHGDKAHCYVKPKDSEDKSPPSYATVVFLMEQPEEEKVAEDDAESASGEANSSQSATADSSSSSTDICQQVVAAFNETLTNELPQSKTKGATIAVGAIVVDGNIQQWVAGASSIIGADGDFTVTDLGAPSGSKYDAYAEGIRLGESSNVRACNGNQQFTYPNNPARPLQGHAESKIIEDWFKSGTSKNSVLYLKIGGAQTQPCSNCDSLIKFVNSGGNTCPKVTLCQ